MYCADVTVVVRQPVELSCIVSGQGVSCERTFVNDSDASIDDHWAKHKALISTDGSRVYERTRIPTPPLEVQEAYHRLKPVDDIVQGRKKQIRRQRRFDPVVYNRALKLAERRRRLTAAPVGSGAELQSILRRRFNLNVAAPTVASFLQTAATSGLQTVDPGLVDPNLPVVGDLTNTEPSQPEVDAAAAGLVVPEAGQD